MDNKSQFKKTFEISDVNSILLLYFNKFSCKFGSIEVNLPDFSKEIQALNKNKTYLLYCRSGTRTRKAADAMQKMGFKHVYMLEGGITAWKEAGKEVVK